MYTSPHLISVRERIRINSTPISPDLFAKYFFEVWHLLGAESSTRPSYFRYLTLMSFHVFLQEGVNVAIYETGVGGRYDSTNIVEHPACTGITSLGIDHTYTLGNTIEQIAWQKGGIFKRGSPSFSVHQKHQKEVMSVLNKCAVVVGNRMICVDNNVPEYTSRRILGVKIQPNLPAQRSAPILYIFNFCKNLL